MPWLEPVIAAFLPLRPRSISTLRRRQMSSRIIDRMRRTRGRVHARDRSMAVALPKVWLKEGREKSLRRRHPWVFSGAIERVDGAVEPGATVEIVTAAGGFVARAAFSPASQIRARVWSF